MKMYFYSKSPLLDDGGFAKGIKKYSPNTHNRNTQCVQKLDTTVYPESVLSHILVFEASGVQSTDCKKSLVRLESNFLTSEIFKVLAHALYPLKKYFKT
jgi:hypothetical protein